MKPDCRNTGSISSLAVTCQSAIGEDIDNRNPRWSDTHGSISGVADYVCDDDDDALKKIRRIVSHLKEPTETAGIARTVHATRRPEYLLRPSSRAGSTLRDAGVDCGIGRRRSFTEYKKDYGKTIVTGYAKIDGGAWHRSQPAAARQIQKDGMQFGGSFIRQC